MPLTVVPAAAFTASLLFDVLSVVADNREQAHSYQRGSADVLRLGLSGSLASVALGIADYLRAPAGEVAADATRKFAVDGAVIAIYLLDLAARQDRAGDVRPAAAQVDALPIGLSLLGLAILGVSANLD